MSDHFALRQERELALSTITPRSLRRQEDPASESYINAAEPEGKAAAIRPVVWLHYPRTGSSFVVALVHHACGSRIPQNFTLLDPVDPLPWKPNITKPCKYNGKKVKRGWANYSTCRWNMLCGEGMFDRFSGGHDPLWLHPSVDPVWSTPTRPWPHPSVGQPFGLIPKVYEDDLARVVTIFREPRQRLISQYHHLLSKGQNLKFKWASEKYSACMTQMTLGAACGRLGEDGTPFLFGLTADQAKDGAVSRVRRFGFVALWEEGALSVCLYHAMFGGECLPAEFLQPPNGVAGSAAQYIVSEYGLGKDYAPLDDEVYRVAQEVFYTRLASHGVNREMCRSRICPRAASYFA